jgi:hypothetical protein
MTATLVVLGFVAASCRIALRIARAIRSVNDRED